MSVAPSMDDWVVAEARHIAEARGTSLNQFVCDRLNEMTHIDDVESMFRELDAMWSERTYRSPGPWTRAAAHERS